MRAPIFLRFRKDKAPTDCLIEGEKPTQKVLEEPVKEGKPKEPKEEDSENEPAKNDNDYYSSSFSNLDKVFWDNTSTHPRLTKKDLINIMIKLVLTYFHISKTGPYLLVGILTVSKENHFTTRTWTRKTNHHMYKPQRSILSQGREILSTILYATTKRLFYGLQILLV